MEDNFSKIILFDYNMSNIYGILNGLKHQTNQFFDVIALNHNKKDLSFECCKIFQRKNCIDLHCVEFNDSDNNDKIQKCSLVGKITKYFCIIDKYNNEFEDIEFISKLIRFSQDNNECDIEFDKQFKILDDKNQNQKLVFVRKIENCFTLNEKPLLQSTANNIKEKENDKVFFKIIIPNYNNMPYIKQCLDSILNQTFQDFKIIIVDDLSDDGSDKVCEEYSKTYPDKIIFIRLKEKGYAGLARNVGLDYQLTCKYVWFVDSDDWLYDNNVLFNINNSIIENNYPKLIRCPIYHYYGKNSLKNKIQYETADIYKLLLSGAGPVKNCIRSDLSKYHFIENRSKYNDVVWFYKILDSITINDIKIINTPCYVYNRISYTSCQNNFLKIISNKCINDTYELINDLNKYNFVSPVINMCKNNQIRKCLNIKNDVVDLFLKNSYVISIDNLKYQNFCKIFKAHGFNIIPKLKIGSQDKTKSGPYNCKKSHYDIVKYALQNNLSYVCIFEDDAYPCINCKNKFYEYLKEIFNSKNRIDFVLLGWSNHSQVGKCKKTIQTFNNKLNAITSIISGSHAYILFNRQFKSYLDYCDSHDESPIDCYTFKSISNGYVIDYPLFIQYSDHLSMNNHIGYIFYGDHSNPPNNFNVISTYLK